MKVLLKKLSSILLLLNFNFALAQQEVDCNNTQLTQVPRNACIALKKIYNDLNGPGWVNNSNWMYQYPVLSWHGVISELSDDDGDGFYDIKKINLMNNNLSGNLSLEMFFTNMNGTQAPIFRTLKELDLSSNPALSGNLFSSIISNSGAPASSLIEKIQLSHTQVSGNLPQNLGTFSKLKQLFLQDTKISGSLPSSYPTEPVTLELTFRNSSGQGNLSGELPQSLGTLKNLLKLDIIGNKLSGHANVFSSQNEKLKYLYLDNNKFSGPFPSSLFSVPQIVKIRLSNNKFGGVLPPVPAGSLQKLDLLVLNKNQFQGIIPESYGLPQLAPFYGSADFSDNYFRGNVSELHPNLRENDASSVVGNCMQTGEGFIQQHPQRLKGCLLRPYVPQTESRLKRRD